MPSKMIEFEIFNIKRKKVRKILFKIRFDIIVNRSKVV